MLQVSKVDILRNAIACYRESKKSELEYCKETQQLIDERTATLSAIIQVLDIIEKNIRYEKGQIIINTH